MIKFIKRSLYLIVLTATVFSVGCSRWDFYMVKSTFNMSKQESDYPEVTRTNEYNRVIRNVKKIAVQAPEQCANETLAQSTGGNIKSERGGVLLKSACGQEMAQMESGLAKQGYRVISWKVVQNKSVASNSTALDVAKNLGADILLQINSLARTKVVPGRDARWDRSYYESDSAGFDGDPIEVNKRISDQLQAFAKTHEKSKLEASRLSASLSSTAIAVATGEAIWFYEWTVIHDTDENRTKVKTFAACKKGWCKHWYPKNPRRGATQQTAYAGSSEVVSSPELTDEDRAIHNRLVEKIITDMVAQFKTGGIKR